jgi:hypothetical protein
MQRLILIKSGHASTFGDVDAPVQYEFSNSHQKRTRHNPDGACMNEAMAGHADEPYLRGAGWILKVFKKMPVLPFG